MGDTRKLYRLIREVTGKFSPVGPSLKELDGTPIADEAAKIKRFQNHFDDLLNRPPPVNQAGAPIDIATHAHGPYRCSSHIPSPAEVKSAAVKLKNGKAAGEDGIAPELLKYGIDAILPSLHDLICDIWRSEEFPEQWKRSTIVPQTHKKGDKALCSNYRGISLISLACKIVENVILCRFRTERDQRTRENQAGFRASRGCADQISTLRSILESRHEYRRPTAVAFLDFKAAFDCADHQTMWKLESPTRLLT